MEPKGEPEATLSAPLLRRLAPVRTSGRAFWIWLACLLALLLSVLVLWPRLVLVGRGLTGESNLGAPWGITVANVVHLVGISHVGIAISAVVRLLRLERYRPLARVAEFVTLAALLGAIFGVAIDVGHPEVFIQRVFYYGRWHAPFVWSMTVITTYLVTSMAYAYLALRGDIARLAVLVPGRARLYRALALGYEDTAPTRALHERTLWWMAVLLLPIMVAVHSVYGLIFGIQAARPGWSNPLQAPYFVLGAIVSGFSAIILVAALLRWLFRWEAELPARMFKGLGIFLGFVVLLYGYFVFTEQLTANYAAPTRELEVSRELLGGRFAVGFWPVVVIGLVVPFAALFIQGVTRRLVSIPLTVTAAALVNAAMWAKRFLLVVPTFSHPHLPLHAAQYTPTRFELWMVIVGTWGTALLVFTLLVKLLPTLELADATAPLPASAVAPWYASSVRRFAFWGTAAAGLALIAVGVGEHRLVGASALWVTGILFLISLPLQICLPRLPSGDEEDEAQQATDGMLVPYE